MSQSILRGMPTYLHQIIAVERGAEAEAKGELDEVRQLLAVGGDRNPLTGLDRTHKPRTDAEIQQPAETRRVQVTTAALLAHATQSLARLAGTAALRGPDIPSP